MTENELAKLYTAFGYFVFRRCIVYLGDPVEAEAALCDAFVEVARAAASRGGTGSAPQPASDPRLELCRAADRLCVERVRKRRALGEPPACDEAALAAALGEDEYEALRTVRRLLAEVEPASLRLALLYYVDELTEEDLARELGLARRTIKKRIEALLGRARELLSEEHAS